MIYNDDYSVNDMRTRISITANKWNNIYFYKKVVKWINESISSKSMKLKILSADITSVSADYYLFKHGVGSSAKFLNLNLVKNLFDPENEDGDKIESNFRKFLLDENDDSFVEYKNNKYKYYYSESSKSSGYRKELVFYNCQITYDSYDNDGGHDEYLETGPYKFTVLLFKHYFQIFFSYCDSKMQKQKKKKEKKNFNKLKEDNENYVQDPNRKNVN